MIELLIEKLNTAEFFTDDKSSGIIKVADDVLLITRFIVQLRYCSGFSVNADFLSNLERELSIDLRDIRTENYKTENLLSSSVQLEELISDIFQTKLLRDEGKHKGNYLRKKIGVFHTPYEVAFLIAKEALHNIEESVRFCLNNNISKHEKEIFYKKFISTTLIDPACGTGIILSAAIDLLISLNIKLKEKFGNLKEYLNKREFVNHLVVNNIFGVDINAEACAITRAILNAKYLDEYRDLSKNIKAGNSLMPEMLFNNGFLFPSAFPHIFTKKKGFDIVVMNPPYERLKVDKSAVKNIDNSKEVYSGDRKKTINFVNTIRNSNQYPLSGVGVLDLYKLFIEKAIQITHENGNVGFIVPLTLLGDVSCSRLRGYIFGKTKVTNIYCIPEKVGIFKNVSQAFCIVGFQKGREPNAFNLFQNVNSFSPLKFKKKVKVEPFVVESISPTTLSVPICDRHGWKMLKKIHKNPRIKEIKDIINLRGELDLTIGKKYITNDPTKERLIRGKMVQRYKIDLTHSGNSSYVDLEKIIQDKALGAKHKYVNSKRLVGQQIVNMGIKNRLRFALCTKGVVGNSCNFITVSSQSHYDLYFLLGILNSLLLNWRFKITSTNNHVNNYEIDDLPIVKIKQENHKYINRIIDLVKNQCQRFDEESQNEIDAIIFMLYGLKYSDIKFVMQEEHLVESKIKEIVTFYTYYAKDNI